MIPAHKALQQQHRHLHGFGHRDHTLSVTQGVAPTLSVIFVSGPRLLHFSLSDTFSDIIGTMPHAHPTERNKGSNGSFRINRVL